MTVIQSLILGIVQGLTEFLPISSSAHLVIVPYLLNWDIDPLEAFIFDVLVQVATIIAVIAYFKNDLISLVKSFINSIKNRNPFGDPQARLSWFLLIATIPAGIIGFLLRDLVQYTFNNIVFTAVALIFTAILLVVAEFVGKKTRQIGDMKILDAIWIGFFQVLAVFPGVSRSGATITGGMTRDLERYTSARFAFLLSIPIMLAAGLFAMIELFGYPDVTVKLVKFLPGLVSSAIVGYLSIRWLLKFMVTRPLYIFSIYCGILGSLILLFYYF